MRKTTFYKMHGCGNDFVIIDNRVLNIKLTKNNIINISHRNFGVGCDQLIIIENSTIADCKMIIYNPNGTESGACGNATRCVAKLIMNSKSKYLSVEVGDRILEVNKLNNQYKVNMGKPELDWKKIPLIRDFEDVLNLPISVGDFNNPSAISMGNPHMIFFVENIDLLAVENLGKILEYHEFFPERVNVSFAKINSKESIEIVTWERGVGITLACGTAACASFAAAYLKGYISNQAIVKSKGGEILISMINNEIHMQADAMLVFEGLLFI